LKVALDNIDDELTQSGEQWSLVCKYKIFAVVETIAGKRGSMGTDLDPVLHFR